MSDEFKDVSTVPTLTLEPFQEEEKKKHRKRWQISQKVLWKM